MTYQIDYDPVGSNHWNFVHDNVMRVMNHTWDPHGDEGEGDCQARSIDAFETYGDPRFLKGIMFCWQLKQARGGKVFYFGWRSPSDRYRMDMSRDHLWAAMFAHYFKNGTFGLVTFYTAVPWKFSFGFRQTIDMPLWVRAMAEKRYAKLLYYGTQIPGKLAIALWSWFWCLVLGVKKEVTQEEFMENREYYYGQSQNKQKWLKLIPPIYSLATTAQAVELLPDSIWKKILSRILLLRTPRNNWLIKIRLGARLTARDLFGIDNYRSMIGNRWTTSLDIRCRRHLEFRKPELSRSNRLDKDHLYAKYMQRRGLRPKVSTILNNKPD